MWPLKLTQADEACCREFTALLTCASLPVAVKVLLFKVITNVVAQGSHCQKKLE